MRDRRDLRETNSGFLFFCSVAEFSFYLLNSSGSFATLAAILLASSFVSNFAADRRLILIIDVRELLLVVVADDEAGGLFFEFSVGDFETAPRQTFPERMEFLPGRGHAGWRSLPLR